MSLFFRVQSQPVQVESSDARFLKSQGKVTKELYIVHFKLSRSTYDRDKQQAIFQIIAKIQNISNRGANSGHFHLSELHNVCQNI